MQRLAALYLMVSIASAGCTQGTAKTASAPEKPKAEGDLAYTTLPKEAYNSLEGGIKIQQAKVQDVQSRLGLTGWVMAKTGNEVILTAPAAGYVHFREKSHTPIAGERVEAGQELLHLEPVLSRLESIQFETLKVGVENDLAKAQVSLKTAEADLKRMNAVVGLRSEQELEQAKKAVDHATQDVKAAKDKLTYFQSQIIKLSAPQAGTVLQLHAGPGQYVPVAAPLITIIDLRPIWVRVPVPEFELPLVDRTQSIGVTFKSLHADDDGKPILFRARPVGNVAQVDLQKHTADLLYELEGGKYLDRFVKDLMVTAHVPIGRKEKATIVPSDAIVYDAYGHAWLYLERTADSDAAHKFERRRVESMISGDGGVIVRPPLTDGDRVVIHGAAGLYSREFHKPPVKIAREKD